MLATLQGELLHHNENPLKEIHIGMRIGRSHSDWLSFLGKVRWSACHPRREFCPKPTSHFSNQAEDTQRWNLSTEKTRAIEGTIRISLHFLFLLFNDLVFPTISSKSFRFRSVVFSTPTRFRQEECVGNSSSSAESYFIFACLFRGEMKHFCLRATSND